MDNNLSPWGLKFNQVLLLRFGSVEIHVALLPAETDMDKAYKDMHKANGSKAVIAHQHQEVY